MSPEETWYDLPVLELADFLKIHIVSSNVTVRGLATYIYRELYRTTNGKINEVKDYIDLSDKQEKIFYSYSICWRTVAVWKQP